MEKWLPRGFQISNDVSVAKLLSFGDEWQLYLTGNKGFAVAISPALQEKWNGLSLLPKDLLSEKTVDNHLVYVAYDKHDNMISSVKHGPYPSNYSDAVAFAIALKKSRSLIPNTSFGDAIYFERYSMILPTYDADAIEDQMVLCRWLSSGVSISTDQFERLSEIVSWLSPPALANIIHEAGFSVPQETVISIAKEHSASDEKERTKSTESHPRREMGDHFSLPGRPALEIFFNEHVVDIIQNSEKYQRMGIGFPSAIVLHGPPGCGKTFAVEKLVEFLGWPSFSIDSGSIGSPYIHDTSKKISEIFDRAIKNAPSVIVVDEMEAFLSAREISASSGQHHMEEMAEFLRCIPEAVSKQVLIVAMTNMIDRIDPAILRRGRFDHVIEIQMPSKEEVESLLKHLLSSLPVSPDIDYTNLSEQLQGHALSDVSFVVKEAGRLAVKSDSLEITHQLLQKAIDALPKNKENKRKIGF